MSFFPTRSTQCLAVLQRLTSAPWPFRSFRREESGVASIEFALLGTVLIVMFTGGFDLVYMISAKRDTDRASMLIAHAMATCPRSSCMSDFINTYLPRQKNALVRYPSASIELYMIQYFKIGNQLPELKPCSGTNTTLNDEKLKVTAKSVLKINDVGSAVLVKTKYTSLFPYAVGKYISSGTQEYEGRTVDVMANIGSLC